eukprot:COSAG01_NODE_42336_length_441_cov_0.745614_1_plen_36_part_10
MADEPHPFVAANQQWPWNVSLDDAGPIVAECGWVRQ